MPCLHLWYFSESSDDERTRRDQIGQIFADDDLIAKDFESEKSEIRRSKKPKDVSMRLPGETIFYFF
jgi:U3 small nucleolar RNA-associated protein 14